MEEPTIYIDAFNKASKAVEVFFDHLDKNVSNEEMYLVMTFALPMVADYFRHDEEFQKSAIYDDRQIPAIDLMTGEKNTDSEML